MTTLQKQFLDAFGIGFEDWTRPALNSSYPPYNIVKRGENIYTIDIAVAGFGEDDIEAAVNRNTLTIEGEVSGLDEDNVFLHKGIASRPFKHEFVLAEHVEVEDLTMDNGILTVKLRKSLPEALKPKKLTITK